MGSTGSSRVHAEFHQPHIGVVVLVAAVLAAAGGAWYFLRAGEASLDDVIAAVEDNGLECEDPEELDGEDLDDAADQLGKEVGDALDAARETAGNADLEGIDCQDPDDEDRGAAILAYSDGGDDRVALVLRSDRRAFDADDVDGSVEVVTFDPNGGGGGTAAVEACKIERRTLITALEAHNAEWGYYPDYLDELSDYLDDIPSEDDWYYDSYEGTVEALSGDTFSEDVASECNGD